MQDLVGLGPQLARVVRGQGGELAAQFVEGAAQRLAEDGEELLVPGRERLVTVLLALGQSGDPVLLGGEFLGVLFGDRGELGRVLLLGTSGLRLMLLDGAGERLRVLRGGALRLLVAPVDLFRVLRDELVVGPPVGERHHGADQLVTVTHGRRRHVDGHLRAALRPQDLPAHPVLAPGAQGVGERGLLVRERLAVGA